ncbi:hypothetical protein IT072_20300 [Leifsonia sp. ZF2019]|uniref:hypothetical protein n=1 Tax=Leifsonia sp. ZF2019 TaxID=2781978 RepID=UPI001CBD9A1E|nr:hypothetical protein [Leifsonia sp. ZF2019]UAJ79488.1 hypothetical protein IT072_20300 [Leifsonia sp. ZF2019]
MDTILLPLLQSAGAVALAVVAFSLAFTWTALTPSLDRMRTERGRLLGYLALGAVLVLAAATIYLVPGLLMRDTVGLALAFPLAAVWLIAAAALLVTGLVHTGAARAVSSSLAVVSVAGVAAGIVSALCAQHGLADRVTPTGAFLLVIGGIAAVVVWSGREGDQGASASTGSGLLPRQRRETHTTP